MTTLAPHLTLFVTTAGVGLLMLWAGVGKNALEWRRRRRSCPSCGRHIDGRTCGCVRG